MTRLCIYAASSEKVSAETKETSRQVAQAAAEMGWDLIFGGAKVGLMNIAAKAMQMAGAHVTSVIPEIFHGNRLTYDEADEVIVTPDLRQRKEIMQQRAEGFLVLPGGLGTLDELFETLTLIQIGVLDASVVVFNHDGHFDATRDQINSVVAQGYASEESLRHLVFADSVADAVSALGTIRPGGPGRRP